MFKRAESLPSPCFRSRLLPVLGGLGHGEMLQAILLVSNDNSGAVLLP